MVGRPSFKVRSAASGNYYFACLGLPSLYFSNHFSFQVQSISVGNRMVFMQRLFEIVRKVLLTKGPQTLMNINDSRSSPPPSEWENEFCL